MAPNRIPFLFETRYRIAGLPFGVTPSSAYLDLDDDTLLVRFGPWRVETPRSNIAGAGVTGPYSFVKTAGSAHLSLADRGLTFATNDRAGVCLQFRDPVRGMDPFGLLRHPGLTVTVERPQDLVDQLTTEAPVRRTDVERIEHEQQIIDDLHTMTASELRATADELGLDRTSSRSKAQLVTLIESRTGGDPERLAEIVETD